MAYVRILLGNDKVILVPALAETVDHFNNGLLSENTVGEFVSLIDKEDSAKGGIKKPLRLWARYSQHILQSNR